MLRTGLQTEVADDLDGVRLLDRNEIRHADRLRLVELVLDLLVDVDAGDRRARDEQHREQPRPDRPAPRGLVVVEVLAGGRPRRPPRGNRRGGRRHDHGRRRVRERGAAEHRRRRVLRLARDPEPAIDALEVGVHLLRVLVPRGRVLGERAQDHHLERSRDVGPLRRRRRGRRRQVLHRDLDRRVAGERDGAGRAARRARSRASRDPSVWSTCVPRACSGERYCAVPMIEPSSVIWLAPARAMPKSVTFT